MHKEFEWMAKNKVEYIDNADSNFGLYKERDTKIVDLLVDLKKKHGFPIVFRNDWAKDKGADCIIMDDGFQNPTIKKDFSIIVINGEQEFGNKRVIPSGPLRESINRGLTRTNLIIVIGKISREIKEKIPSHIPIIYSSFAINNENKTFKGQKISAFAGIAYPEKFFNSLRDQGAKLVKEVIYPDHHIYGENDLLNLAEIANKTQSILVTTKKDFVRIPRSYRSLINTLYGEIEFEDEKLLSEILTNILENKINSIQ